VDDLEYDYNDIYHLASPVGALGILDRNGFVAKNIIDLTYKAINISLKSQAKLLYVSSSEIYGHSGIHKETEVKQITNVYGTRTEYALGKLTSETIIENLNINKAFPFNIVRPFNVVGEQQSASIGFVFPTFFEHAFKNENIPIFYSGLQKRSFCYVGDIVKAMVKIQHANINNEIFNIGHDNNTTTIIDLARKIKLICKSKSKIVNIDPIKKYGKCYQEAFDKIPDIGKVNSTLGWYPEVGLDCIIKKLYNYYKSRLNPKY